MSSSPKPKTASKSAPDSLKVVAEVTGFRLVRSGKPKKLPAPGVATAREASDALLKRVGYALRDPGIAQRPSVKNAYAYSANPQDLSQVIQRAPDGTKRIGRLVQGKFIPAKTPK